MDNEEMVFEFLLEELLNKLDSPKRIKEAIYRIFYLLISTIADEAIHFPLRHWHKVDFRLLHYVI
ncbi:hypothetical protein ES703_39280 [subsurface metagenome]